MTKYLSFICSMRFARTLLLLSLVALAFTPAAPAQAQTIEAFNTTLAELGYADQILYGPIDQTSYYFSLPADWQPQAGSSLELNLSYELVGQHPGDSALLEVLLNDKTLLMKSFLEPGVSTLHIDLPPGYLRLAEDRYLNQLQFRLQAYYADCKEGNWSIVSLVVQNSSSLIFKYVTKPLVLDLAHYPKPIFQSRAFLPSQVHFILPDPPSNTDLQSATIIAAKLGELTGDKLPMTASFTSSISQEILKEEHLFVIGQPEENALIKQLDLPLPLIERELEIRSELPSTVITGEEFSIKLTVNNTSALDRDLVVEDRWPIGAIVKSCEAPCTGVDSNVLRWEISQLKAGQETSIQATISLDQDLFLPGDQVEHTAALYNDTGDVINVDTLATNVSADTPNEAETVVSTDEKSRYFFAVNGQAVSEEDGIIQAIVSPWSDRRAMIVVTGLADQAILKAGKALGSESAFPGMTGTYAIVQATLPVTPTKTQLAENASLDSLGYKDTELSFFNTQVYGFDLPYGWTIDQGALLAFHFAHGAALNNISAAVEIGLNGAQIYSIPLNEDNVASTWSIVPLPPSILLGGFNQLTFELSGDFDICITDWFARGFWLTIYSDSLLHLPFANKETILDLDIFPQPFSAQPDLGNVLFTLPENPTESEISGTLNLAALMGSVAGGASLSPDLTLETAPDSAKLKGKQLIAIGRPSANSNIAAINDHLPQPFIPGTDTIRQQVDNVVYQLMPDTSMGYIQLLASPWDEQQGIMVVTGSTDEGVAWAMNALTNQTLRDQLSGNLAILTQQGVLQTTDTRSKAPAGSLEEFYSELMASLFKATTTPETRIEPTPTAAPTQPPAATTATLNPIAAPVSTPDTSAQRTHPIWIVPLLILSALVVLIAALIYLRKNR
ncbi:MAG: cellulose biosynthesis cyclic di-GMP-binding regulatory protein BcsB [Anaerolineales bacterium]|nr:cellulose biosynthesis cyclic di-GMP-binding regulatory protein BcsB [Anaerolineales bacterium]